MNADREAAVREVAVSGVWLRGGENEVVVLVELDGEWIEVIREYLPLHGNDGTVWPVSHIVEVGGIQSAARKDAALDAAGEQT